MGCSGSKYDTLADKVRLTIRRRSTHNNESCSSEDEPAAHYSLKEHISMQVRSSKRHHSFRNSERAIEQIQRKDQEVVVDGIVSGWDAAKLAGAIAESDSLKVLSVEVELSADFGEESVGTLISGLENSTSVEELRLIGAGNCGAVMFGEFLAKQGLKDEKEPPLTSCHLVGGEALEETGIKALARGIRFDNKLERLRLAYMQMDDKKAVYLAKEGLAHSKTLRDVDLSGNCITDSGLQLICQSVPAGLIQRLCLRNNHLQDVSALLLTKGLKQLYLGRNSVGNHLEAVASLLKTSNSLEKLELECNHIDVEGCRVLSTGVSEAKALKELNLSANPIDDEGLKIILDVLPSTIESISFRSCKLTLESAKLVSESLSRFPKLKSVSLAENSIGEEGLALLLAATKQHLFLERMAFDRDLTSVTDAIVPCITQSLVGHRSMKVLSLRNTRISSTQALRIDALLSALHSERARMMTALVAPLWIERMRKPKEADANSKCFISWLPVELFRLLCDTLYD